MKILKNKTVLITGGTGSIGEALVKKLFWMVLKKSRFLAMMKMDFMKWNWNMAGIISSLLLEM